MRRALSLYLPWWPIERRRRRFGTAHKDNPYRLVVETAANRQVVRCVCPRCVDCGVEPGMTLSHARALLPTDESSPLLIDEHDDARDRSRLERLAEWTLRLAPLVAADPPDGLLMDVAGCERMYGGERNLLDQLLTAVRRLGLTAQAAIAPTWGAAWALARYVDSSDAPILDHPGAIRPALEPAPLAALRLDETTIDALHEVGVRRIGELLELPRRQLPARFADDLLLRVDQALGDSLETIRPVRPRGTPIAQQSFNGPVVNLQGVQITIRRLLEQFAAQLLQREAGVLELLCTLERYDADPIRLRLPVSRATRDAEHLDRLLSPMIEKANLGHGVETIELRAASVGRLPHRQQSNRTLGGDDDEQRDALNRSQGRLIDTLTHRLGGDRVLRMQHRASHIPERATYLTPFGRAVSTENESENARVVRPTQLLDVPKSVAVQALTPDGPVLRLYWRGDNRRVARCFGPERITSEWWREPTGARDYFRIELDTGERLWAYRTDAQIDGDAKADSRWFVHGWWA